MSLSSERPGPDPAHHEVAENARWLQQRAMNLTRSRDLARDLVQETFAAWLHKPPTIEHSLRGWLEAVLRNHYRMWCRGNDRRHRRELAIEETPDLDTPDTEIDRGRVSGWLRHEIEQVQEPYRSTLRLRYYDNLRPAEIARALGVPQSTVRRRSMIGLRMLKARMLTRFGGTEGVLDAALMRSFALPIAAPGGGGLFEGLRRWLHESLTSRRLAWRALGTATAAATLAIVLGGTGDPQPGAHARAARLASHQTVAADPPLGPLVVVTPGDAPAAGADDEAELPPAPPETPADDGSGFFGEPDDEPEARALATRPAALPLSRSCGSLQERINRAPAGATLSVPPCVFRESLVIDKPITLTAQPGAEIRGSDVFARFVARGALYESVARVPAFAHLACSPTPAGDNSNDAICWTFEQVFVDGERLRPAAAGALPGAGEFALTAARTVVLAGNPEGHTVEVTVRPTWARVEANDVTITGFTMTHALGGPHHAALQIHAPWARARIENNRLTHSGGIGLTAAGFDHVIASNRITDSGAAAIQMRATERLTVEANHLEHNGRAHRRDNGWVTGGIIISEASGVVRGNTIVGNEGTGLACFHCRDLGIAGNRIGGNSAAGVIAYYSEQGSISHNELWRNGAGYAPPHPGLFLTASKSVRVSDNTFAFHDRAIAVNVQDVDDGRLPPGFQTCAKSSNNSVEGNLFVASGTRGVVLSGDPRIGVTEDAVPPCPSNRSWANRLWDAGLRDGGSLAAATGVLPLSPLERDAVLARYAAGDSADVGAPFNL